ncbi:MAG: hypothetical protein ACRYF4_05700 [Janthinobacterium lividum]
MTSVRVFLICSSMCLLSGANAAVKPSAFGNQSKPMKASVRILAISSSSEQSFAGNQEIYLADVQVKDGEHRFARLVDQYPGFGLPIRPSLLRDGTLFSMRLTREPECDVPGSKIYLRRDDSGVFDGSVRDSLASRAAVAIPCFKTLHQTIEVSKH